MTTLDSGIHARLTALEADAERGRLLKKYAERDPKQFIQYDAFHRDGGEDMFGLYTTELMQGTPCRVLIDPETTSQDAAMMLRRIADWIDRSGLIEKPDPNGDDIPF